MSMITSIDELVAVKVSFNGTLVRPELIRWRGREIAIDQVNLVHSHCIGRVKCVTFSVSNDTTAYKIEFNTESLMWRLIEVFTS